MKYLIIGIGYFLLWIYFICYLLFERFVKTVSLFILFFWHFYFNKAWLERFDVIDFIIPIPVLSVLWTWEIEFNLKDYFSLNNWKKS